MFKAYQTSKTADALRKAGFDEQNIWGHRVADRAIDFLNKVGNDRFVLAVSFDEPHGPCVAPPEYWERFEKIGLPCRPNYNAPIEGKPKLLQLFREQKDASPQPVNGLLHYPAFLGCNSYIDREIGRVIAAVDRLHADDTMIIYTSDHGDQLGSHGLVSKGPMMYEETSNIPLIIRSPGGARGAVSDALISHVDLIPTMLDLAGIEQPAEAILACRQELDPSEGREKRKECVCKRLGG
jgi:uncharacterized sulfatase